MVRLKILIFIIFMGVTIGPVFCLTNLDSIHLKEILSIGTLDDDLIFFLTSVVADEEEYIYTISDRDIECDGCMEIIELNHRFGSNIPVGEYETIAGYVIYLMEKIPKTGEYVDTDEVRIFVLDADARSIQKVRIHNKISKFMY